MKKILSLVLCVVLLSAICLSSVACNLSAFYTPEETTSQQTTPVQNEQEQPAQDQNDLDYNQALALLEKGDYEGAKALFEKLDGYKDSEEYLSKFYYMPIHFELKMTEKTGSIDVVYNSNNLPEKDLITRNETEEYVCDFVYDENGVILKQVMNRDGGVSTYEFTYGSAHGFPDVAVNNLHNGPQSIHEFTRNEQGQLIREIFTSDGVVMYDYNPIYDEKGNVIREEYRESDPPQIIYISYEYNENDQIVQATRDFGSGYLVFEYTYDERGNLIKEVLTYNDGYQIIYEYTFDEFDNRIKVVRTEDGEVEFLEINYKLLYLPLGFPTGSKYFFEQYWNIL